MYVRSKSPENAIAQMAYIMASLRLPHVRFAPLALVSGDARGDLACVT